MFASPKLNLIPQSSRCARRPEAHTSPAAFAVALKSRGVLVAPFVGGSLRAVTHVDVSEDDVHFAVQTIASVLEETSRAGPTSNGSNGSVKSPYGEW